MLVMGKCMFRVLSSAPKSSFNISSACGAKGGGGGGGNSSMRAKSRRVGSAKAGHVGGGGDSAAFHTLATSMSMAPGDLFRGKKLVNTTSGG